MDKVMRLNDLSLIFVLMHRFSEIVSYKPEQMVKLLKGKKNWIIHVFLPWLWINSFQFIDRIAAEITKQEIMPTRHRA